ncbi:flavin reductase [Novosphingobium resinovorum]|uniref:flavin reductase n=1 Tax=Novosphingobium resinovorum TaxID=158500 RepID=UPI002ED5782C|nr:flavin reductase [Novosphingobium resinovorum]
MIDIQDFRSAMARLGAAVNVITTNGADGRFGMTASAVCSVSDDPATLLLCVNRNARMNGILKANGRFAVNVLSARQEEFSRCFADSTLSMDERFGRCGPWHNMTGELPGLTGALAVFACTVASVTEVGTHSLFIGSVEQLLLGEEDEGLVYFGRRYHALRGAAMPQALSA